MNKIKKYWKEILIGILVIFSLNKCTVACNRNSKINKQNTEIVQKDSLIQVQADSLNILKIRWKDMQESQHTYQGLAIGNQNELINIIEDQKNKIAYMTGQIQKLTSENAQLKKEIKSLKANQ